MNWKFVWKKIVFKLEIFLKNLTNMIYFRTKKGKKGWKGKKKGKKGREKGKKEKQGK